MTAVEAEEDFQTSSSDKWSSLAPDVLMVGNLVANSRLQASLERNRPVTLSGLFDLFRCNYHVFPWSINPKLIEKQMLKTTDTNPDFYFKIEITINEGKEALNSNHLAASPVNLSCQTNFPRLTQLDFTQSLKYPPGVIDGQRMDKKSVPICENAIVDAKPQNPGKKLLA
ncbi:unnamed protein product [Allacma fusca]|uniref:Uncharacterized protein n=1 Tax=Allacma fusca TaxID=39272 RepID=A0A8J2NWX6_9HEXA|nr:unnamed protein product [Allacma fusca]